MSTPAQPPSRILVIKLGALGDFVLAMGPFAAIRRHHPDSRIVLLTTAPFVPLARRCSWFDAVAIDRRAPWWNLRALLRLRRRLAGFDMVYDLQTSRRSSRYHRLAGRPPWSGIAPGASHPDDDPDRDYLHTVDRQRGQLRRAGIAAAPFPDLGFLRAGGPAIPGPFAVLVPGASPHRPAKRWAAERFGVLAARLHRERALLPVVVGSADEAPLAAAIRAACPEALDLCGRTDLPALAALMGRAALAIGNDTGPMHLAAAMGAPTLTLFSHESDPALTAPNGPDPTRVAVLRVPDLSALDPAPVLDRVATLLR
ncbi:MAG: glycosyltransferase family 9 protein [Caulobacteraceae bacterium]|nr:glycosyltransferase family 9 protein [Caulobacter sp.]